MDFNTIRKTLSEQGIPPDSVLRCALALQEAGMKSTGLSKTNDWAIILRPLKKAIASAQSSAYLWRADPLKAPIYETYLEVLLRTRARIENAKALNVVGKSIPAIAEEKNLPAQGLRWSAWVPHKVEHAMRLEFERLYNVTLPDAMRRGERKAVGKRLIPFSTASERSVSDTRWERLHAYCVAALDANRLETCADPYMRALTEAVHVIKHRDIGRIAPVNWTHVLSVETRAAYNEWVAAALPIAPAQAHEAPTKPLAATLAEKAALSDQRRTNRLAKMRTRAAARRRATGMVERTTTPKGESYE